MDLSFYKGKKVLLTGHTGFKGAWMLMLLKELGAKVYGMSLPAAENALYNLINGVDLCEDEALIDIRDRVQVLRYINFWEPDIIIHMAAQAIVQESYQQPLYTFQVNVEGSINILEAVRILNKNTLNLMITTDKVYQNLEEGRPFKENDPLGGQDPYSASKAAMEIAVDSYYQSFLKDAGHQLIKLRAGNVIGGGDRSAYRLIPDVINTWEKGEILKVRSPKAIRPWQHVLEALYAYLQLGVLLNEGKIKSGDAFNIGPKATAVLSVEEMLEQVSGLLTDLEWVYEAAGEEMGKEAQTLLLDVSKTSQAIKEEKKLEAQQAIDWTIRWYQSEEEALVKSQAQIKEFLS